MPKSIPSQNRDRFRSQPYGWRSVQSSQQSVFGVSFPNNSEIQTSTVQPVDQVAPEGPIIDTGEHTEESADFDWHVIPPLGDRPRPDIGPLHLEGNIFGTYLDGTGESMLALQDALPPAPKCMTTRVMGADDPNDILVNAGPSVPPRSPRYSRPRYDSYRPLELKMVDSMVLQSIGRTNSRAPPSMSIHNNSRGGGIQDNVFTKVPSASKTISFRVDSEETLIQAYRHVKAMNPSAPVGGIMFSVPPKTEETEFHFTEVNNIRWNALTGRQNQELPPGVNIVRNRDGGFTIDA